MDLTAVKHIHILCVVVFLVSYLIKTGLLFAGKQDTFARFRKKTLVPEMIFATLFLITGVYMLVQLGMASLGGWFHLKLTLVILAIPLGILGFKKESKPLALASTLVFVYVFFLALQKNMTLFF